MHHRQTGGSGIILLDLDHQEKMIINRTNKNNHTSSHICSTFVEVSLKKHPSNRLII